MQFSRLLHYGKRTLEVGPRAALRVAAERTRSAIFEYKNRKKASAHVAGHSWSKIADRHGVAQSSIQFFKERVQNWHFETMEHCAPVEPQTVEQAQKFVQQKFALLGSETQKFSTMPWHTDFRLQQQNPEADCSFAAHDYYKDIQIKNGTSELIKDIKVPWELSRFQHLLVLGQAYTLTQEQSYADAFVSQITDWLDNNPLLLGTNWVCPMDVGIRAVNWIWAFHYFKKAAISSAFWERFVCSLYDHLIYLENNWELYDSITSNHYLSDLIGYFYLCYFFDALPGIRTKGLWCHRELIKEQEKQVFEEGTDYEGSTSYHRLVTEIFYHHYTLAQEYNFTVPTPYVIRLERMVEFVRWCTTADNCKGGDESRYAVIGDHDSGKLLYNGFPEQLQGIKVKPTVELRGSKQYHSFGLSIIKNHRWHITLRHQAHHQGQVTGHFHADALSMTVAINGIPLFVDPGSYVYTPSVYWRNKFRSAAVHNSFMVAEQEPLVLDERLFALDMPKNAPPVFVTEINNIIQLKAQHRWYQAQGLIAHRSLMVHKDKPELHIMDWWSAAYTSKPIATTWNFTLHPAITVEQHGRILQCFYQHKLLAQLILASDTQIVDGWVSQQYGSKLPCKRIIFQCWMTPQMKNKIIIKI